MVLTPHLIVGAAIGARIQSLGLIVILGILSHFILDKLPHWDYSNNGISNFRKTRNFKALTLDLFKITVDGTIGITIVALLVWHAGLFFDSKNLVFVFIGMLSSTLPDIFLVFVFLFLSQKKSGKIMNFHHRFLHCKKEGRRITFLNLATQILVIFLSIFLFFF